ncbi:uncharacterized protein EDB93DRAFT_1103977 [Suillus bovinus]|uniref:uncharacterized protein n=1 Tax=Suillus bovinus TaxID=48563 RepID=UPI001B867681|nr:uncharacterized protein EDB93DRAFT_1103977 [Suillus bovinus]KAG2147903.1 hypothetical protein EDB93DRAFT_1103977 [Suillus bovinus]
MPHKTNTSIPPITWTSDLVWKLIAEVKRLVNLKVLFGIKEDNDSKTGDQKISAYKTIANTILPEVFALDPRTAIDRTQKKVESLRVTYVKHAAALKQTGGGLKDGENPSDKNSLMNILK